MTPEHIRKLITLFNEYTALHDSLNEILEQARELEAHRAVVSKQLEDIRNSEKILINKIEEDLDRKLTQDDLLQALQSNEN